jgi:hypothetical protein
MERDGVLLAVDAEHASGGFPTRVTEGRSSSVLGHQGWTIPLWQRLARAGRGPHRIPCLQPWAARATRPQTPWGAGAGGGLALFARLLRLLSDLSQALSSEREARASVALALQALQSGELPVEPVMTREPVLNLKTAQALGLTIPPTLRFQADEVIRSAIMPARPMTSGVLPVQSSTSMA